MSQRHETTGLAGDAAAGAGRVDAHAERSRAALFERIAGRIFRYFHRAVWNRDEAEDLAQETLLRLDRSLQEGTYDPARSFNAWMWLKAHTVFAQWCRKRARRPERLPTGEEPPDPADPVRASEEALDARRVLRAVEERLGEEAYETFLLYYQGGLSQVELAALLGRNRKTIVRRLESCHALIDRLLEGR